MGNLCDNACESEREHARNKAKEIFSITSNSQPIQAEPLSQYGIGGREHQVDILLPDGSKYSGEWLNGLMDGHGC